MRTKVHLLRHGEVHNPEGILYGRSAGFFLSQRGRAMAQRIAKSIGDQDITHIVSSPLERAQETAAPLAQVRGVEVLLDERLIESENAFAGKKFTIKNSLVLNPGVWPRLINPFRPSWGEPYKDIAARMWPAVLEARDAAAGHEAVVVSHQLPIWVTRLHAEGKRFAHDPRNRQCTLCSLTTLTFLDDQLATISYSEPAADLIPEADRHAAFSSGGADEDPRLTDSGESNPE